MIKDALSTNTDHAGYRYGDDVKELRVTGENTLFEFHDNVYRRWTRFAGAEVLGQ
jgi:hypothetical protein